MDDIPHWITPCYAGLLGLLLLGLSYNVSRERMALKVLLGDGGHPSLQRAIRAQGNLIEYAPMALILLGSLEALGFHHGVLHFLGIVLIAGRLFHAYGLTRNAGASLPRALGAALSWLMILLASLLAILGTVSSARF
jgi:uncharacterized membrane protein YecN with MAPEG domain